jgi:hypothetical protein
MVNLFAMRSDRSPRAKPLFAAALNLKSTHGSELTTGLQEQYEAVVGEFLSDQGQFLNMSEKRCLPSCISNSQVAARQRTGKG